jgi:hypothetical protein
VYQTVPSAATATSWGRDPDGTSYSWTTTWRDVADGEVAPPTRGLVVAGTSDAVVSADVVAGADEAGPGAALSSEPDEHASAAAVVTNDAARMRGHDIRPR